MVSVEQVVALAEKYALQAQMKSSAELCVADAKALLAEGKAEYAKGRALKSLAYSVGVFSPVYQACKG